MNEVELERLIVRLIGDTTKFKQPMKDAQAQLKDFSSQSNLTDGHIQIATKRIQAMGFSLRGYGAEAVAMIAPLVGITGTLAAMARGVQLASEMEQLEIAFGVLTGSAKVAEKTIKDLVKFAAETPFQMPEVVAAARQMLGFGADASSILPTMKSLGDVAAGLSIPLGELTYLFGTLKSQGRAFTVDIRQFASRGIPVMLELAKVMGIASQEAKKLNQAQTEKLNQSIEKGLVNFDLVEKAFQNMTKEGGTFGGMMDKQSKSLSGLFSTMKDDIESFLRDMGKGLIEGFDMKGIVASVSEVAKVFGGVIKPIMPMIKQFIAPLVMAVGIVGTLVAGFALFVALIKPAIVVIAGLFALIFSPIGWAIAALTIVIIKLGGVGKTLEFIKAKAIAAWEWLLPVRRQLVNLWNTLVTHATAAWAFVEANVLMVWGRVTNWFASQGITFEGTVNSIREAILTAFIAAEFGVMNFGRILDLLWLGWKLNTVRTKEEQKHFYTQVLPAFFKYLVEVSKVAFKAFMDVGRDAVDVVGRLFEQLPDILSGKVKLDKVWDDLVRGFSNRTQQIKDDFGNLKFKAPPRVFTDLEKTLKAEFDAAKGALGADFEAFRKKRMAELFGPEAAEAIEDAAGKVAETPISKALQQEKKDIDGALRYSAEAMSRISKYRDAFFAVKPGAVTAGGAPVGVGVPPGPPLAGPPGAAQGGVGGGAKGDAAAVWLPQIHAVLVAMANKKPIPVQAAGL